MKTKITNKNNEKYSEKYVASVHACNMNVASVHACDMNVASVHACDMNVASVHACDMNAVSVLAYKKLSTMIKRPLIITTFLVLLILSSCGNKECADQNALLQQQISDYSEQVNLIKNENDNNVAKLTEFNKTNSLIESYKDSIMILKNSAKSGQSKADIQNFMNKIDELLLTNEKLANEMKSELATLGSNPTQEMLVNLLLDNVKAKNAEIEKLNTELAVAKLDAKRNKEIAELEKKKAEEAEKQKVVAENKVAEVKSEFKSLSGSVSYYTFKGKDGFLFKKGDENLENLKAKKITSIEVTYKIKENSLAKSGSQNIYLKIKSTSTEDVWHNEERLINGKIAYTEVANIVYTGKELTGTITWTKNKDYKIKEGTYEILIFSENGDIIVSDVMFDIKK